MSARRVTIGFQGGQVLPVRLEDEQLRALRQAAESGSWHELQAVDGAVFLDLAQVVYVRTESDDQRVGF